MAEMVRRGLVAGRFVVEVYVGYLRRKIETPFGAATIETVRSVGYRLLGDAES
jgi:two-component system OmpR family response regulator